ncbi:MAG: DedA family protein [Acidimicrobiia bacterium]|nr:DedA family protein [Acidimicrobiia bacterium]
MISASLELVDSLLSWLETFTSSPWFYLVIFVIALLDSVIPIVPSETTVILGGIAAGQEKLSIVLVIVLGALGAFVGDSTAYGLGNRAGGPIRRTLFRGEKGADRLERAGQQIRRRGGLLLITARFIPGGRTALTFSCGLTNQPFLAWFTRWDILAVIIWASYAGLLGFFFGDRFEDDHSTAFWWAFGTALGVTVVIEVVRYVRSVLAGRQPKESTESTV